MDLPRMYWPTLRSFGASLTSAAYLVVWMRIWFESLIVLFTAAVGVAFAWLCAESVCDATTA